MVVEQNRPRQARRGLGEGERAVGMHQMQDIIRKERPDGQDAEDAWCGGGFSGRGRSASGVKVAFANAVWHELAASAYSLGELLTDSF